MSIMLLSIKPEYVEKIMRGEKQYEFRKNQCRKDVRIILFYASAPKKRVVGKAEIETVYVNTPKEIWKLTKGTAGITKKLFFEYYQNSVKAVAYKLTNVVMYDKPRTLSYYGVLHAPQSFVYLLTERTKL